MLRVPQSLKVIVFPTLQIQEMLENRVLCSGCVFDFSDIEEGNAFEKCITAKMENIICYYNELAKMKRDTQLALNWVDPCGGDKSFFNSIAPKLQTSIASIPQTQIDEAFTNSLQNLYSAQAELSKNTQDFNDLVNWRNNLPPLEGRMANMIEARNLV